MSESAVLSVLKSFFNEMGQWERECKRLYRQVKKSELENEELRRLSKLNLQRIFATYCTSSSPARAKEGPPHFSLIPTYGEDLEAIVSVEVSSNSATVLTRQTGRTQFNLRYQLEKTDSGWRILDNRKIINEDGSVDDWDL